jgi:hypothetical protein
MCLRTKTVYKQPRDTPKTAWKVFEIVNGKLRFCYLTEYRVQVGVWMKAKFSRNAYGGFHVFRQKKQALELKRRMMSRPYRSNNLIIIKVDIRGVFASGMDESRIPTILAKEMFIPEGVTK